MTRVIVTADDFGLCPEVNDAVCLLHDRGVVERTSFMMTTPHFRASVEALRSRPALEVAIHLDLTDGRPVLPAAEVPSLVGQDGAFRGGRHYSVLAGILVGRVSRREIRAEWRAQVARARDAGLEIAQLNAHGHLHLIPRLRGIVLDILEEFAIPGLRTVSVDASLRGLFLGLSSIGITRAAWRRGLRLAVPDRVLGLRHSGSLDERRLLHALAGAPRGGVAEIVVHPSLAPNAYHERWGYAGERETRALQSDEVLRALREVSRG